MTEKRFRGGGGEMFGGTQAFRSPTLGPSTAQPGGEVTMGFVTLQLIIRILFFKSLDSATSLSRVHPELFYEKKLQETIILSIMGGRPSKFHFHFFLFDLFLLFLLWINTQILVMCGARSISDICAQVAWRWCGS